MWQSTAVGGSTGRKQAAPKQRPVLSSLTAALLSTASQHRRHILPPAKRTVVGGAAVAVVRGQAAPQGQQPLQAQAAQLRHRAHAVGMQRLQGLGRSWRRRAVATAARPFFLLLLLLLLRLLGGGGRLAFAAARRRRRHQLRCAIGGGLHQGIGARAARRRKLVYHRMPRRQRWTHVRLLVGRGIGGVRSAQVEYRRQGGEPGLQRRARLLGQGGA